MGRKKKTKICESPEEDRLSQLPEHLISEILYHLSTKDAVRTSVLSTRWRCLWQSVPGLDLGPVRFLNSDSLVSFVERFFDSHMDSWIRKLRLDFFYRQGRLDISSWIDAVTTRTIQHLDVACFRDNELQIPPSLYTCETLVHLRLCEVTLSNADFVSLPCLKFMHLLYNRYPNEATLQKLISGSPVLEVLTIIRSWNDDDKANVLLVRSLTLKRVYINDGIQVVIDAPLLQCLKATVSSSKNFQIVNLGSSAKLDIGFPYCHATYSSMIPDILTDISRVRELVIMNATFWKEIFQYSKLGPVLQFRDLSHLSVTFSKSNLEMLPTLLESCPKVESFVLELVTDGFMGGRKKKEPKLLFPTVPQCLLSSLKFVEWKRSIVGYEGEIELIRYLLKNSTMLEKLRLNIYYSKKAMCDFLKELVAMPRCSTACEVLVL